MSQCCKELVPVITGFRSAAACVQSGTGAICLAVEDHTILNRIFPSLYPPVATTHVQFEVRFDRCPIMERR
jgi:hypothetical protein